MGLCAVLLGAGLRIAVLVDGTSVRVVQSWLGLPYRRLNFVRGTVRVDVVGTGDWGDPGTWPVAELCELRGLSGAQTRAVYVGRSQDRQQVREVLRKEVALATLEHAG